MDRVLREETGGSTSESINKRYTIAFIIVILVSLSLFYISWLSGRESQSNLLTDELVESFVGKTSGYIPSKILLDLSYDGPTDLRRYEVYGVSSDGTPSIDRVYFNPLDAFVGERQSMVAQLRNYRPITSVVVEIKTDNEFNTYKFKLIGGTETNGYWGGAWIVSDTHESTYEVTLRAFSGKDQSEVKLQF